VVDDSSADTFSPSPFGSSSYGNLGRGSSTGSYAERSSALDSVAANADDAGMVHQDRDLAKEGVWTALPRWIGASRSLLTALVGFVVLTMFSFSMATLVLYANGSGSDFLP